MLPCQHSGFQPLDSYVLWHHPLCVDLLPINVTTCDQISQAFPLHICTLQAIKYWRWKQPGNEAIIKVSSYYWACKTCEWVSLVGEYIFWSWCTVGSYKNGLYCLLLHKVVSACWTGIWTGMLEWTVEWTMEFCVQQMAPICFIPYSRGSFIESRLLAMYRMSLLELIEYAKDMSP